MNSQFGVSRSLNQFGALSTSQRTNLGACHRSGCGALSAGRSFNMLSARDNSLPLWFSQIPNNTNGKIVAAAHNFALRGSFASGSQRNNCDEMKNANAPHASSEPISTPREKTDFLSTMAR